MSKKIIKYNPQSMWDNILRKDLLSTRNLLKFLEKLGIDEATELLKIKDKTVYIAGGRATSLSNLLDMTEYNKRNPIKGDEE